MRDEYDFSDAVKNPYQDNGKIQITVEVDDETINYFKKLEEANGIPYQVLMSLYLTDCAQKQLVLSTLQK